MMVDSLDQQLRDMFTDDVSDQPLLHAPADTALGRAAVTRRRHRLAVLSVAAALTAIVLAGSALRATVHRTVTPAGSSPAAPSPVAPRPGPTGLDLLVDGAIRTGDGRTLPLPARLRGEKLTGYRVPAGWVLADQGSASGTVTLIGPTGEASRVSQPGRDLLLSADHTENVWSEGSGPDTTLTLGKIGQGPRQEIFAPNGQATAWWRGKIIVAQRADDGASVQGLYVWDPTDHRPARFTTLSPSRGTAALTVSQIVGPSSDGRYLVAYAVDHSGAGYLTVLDPAHQFTTVATAPLLAHLTTAPIESPDHRAVVTVAGSGRARWYNITQLPSATIVSGPACSATGRLGGWEDSTTYLVVRGSTLTRCRIGTSVTGTVHDPRTTGATTVTVLPGPIPTTTR